MSELELLLKQWTNFYIITSGAAATLIGLLFVTITLIATRVQEEVDPAKIRVYLTPTVVYFASVLIVAALLTFPNHILFTATLCICLMGIVGLVYSIISLIQGDKKSYLDWSDRFPYAVFPFASYGLLVLGGSLLFHDTQLGLTLVAVSMLLLLMIAIRNSWAIAIGIISTRLR